MEVIQTHFLHYQSSHLPVTLKQADMQIQLLQKNRWHTFILMIKALKTFIMILVAVACY